MLIVLAPKTYNQFMAPLSDIVLGILITKNLSRISKYTLGCFDYQWKVTKKQ
jgi:hypothetical protein